MIFDLHTDLPTAELSDEEKISFIENNAKNTVTLAVFTARLKEPLSFLKNTVETYSRFSNVRFAVEDVWFAARENFAEITSYPLLYTTLAWGDDNALAGGHLGESGLTALGKEFVKSLNKAGIAADTAHLNEKSFYDVIESGEKIVCSHTCLYSLCPHTRNLKDEQIKAVIASGGLVGLAAVSEFMGKLVASRDDYAKEIATYADKFGTDSLSLGTDFFGTKPIDGFESYDDADGLYNDLIKKGFSDKEIQDIFFNNANKFFST